MLETLRAAIGDTVASLRFERVAEKSSGDPALLEIPLANISRWLALGRSARKRLEGWRSRLLAARESAAGLQSLIALLWDPCAEAEEWRIFSPCAGVLTRDELDGLRWTSRH